MGKTIENIAPTNLASVCDEDHFGAGTLYYEHKTAGGTVVNRTWCWGRNVDATVTVVAGIPCVRMPSTTNEGLFTADFSDGNDTETRSDVGIPRSASTLSHKKYMWYCVKGKVKMRQCTTSPSVAIYDAFRLVGDRTVDTSATFADRAGIFLEEPGVTASLEKYVRLDGRNFG